MKTWRISTVLALLSSTTQATPAPNNNLASHGPTTLLTSISEKLAVDGSLLSSGADVIQTSLEVVLKVISDEVGQAGIRLRSPDGFHWAWSEAGSSPLQVQNSAVFTGYIVTTYIPVTPKPTSASKATFLKTVTLY